MEMSEKPLGRKAYGSIAHLSDSRMGPGDHHCHEGQSRICLEKVRDRHDVVIVQEKLDGSCCSVAKIDGELVALVRAGYTAISSPYEQHHIFDKWVKRNKGKFDFLDEGCRVVGEWLAMAHSTRYKLCHDPFVAFDIVDGNNNKQIFETFQKTAVKNDLVIPNLISYGQSISIKDALSRLNKKHHGAMDEIEGCIWRVERKDKVDFLAKFVRPNKEDGIYFQEKTGKDPVWNFKF